MTTKQCTGASDLAIDLLRARRETPGCERVLHFGNASAGLTPQPVLDAVIEHLRLEAWMGAIEASEHSRAAEERVYRAAADLLGARPDEIAVVENGTRAWQVAVRSLPFGSKDRVLVSTAEWVGNYLSLLQLRAQTGAQIEVLPNDEFGQVSVDALRNLVDERVKLIAIAHVPTSEGLVNPAAAVGRVAREAGIPYMLDACQSVGQMPVDVQEIGCDFLAATSRKYLRGPRGVGFLYVRRGLIEGLEPPSVNHRAATWVARDGYELRPDARRFENWEINHASKIGLGVAIDYAMGWGLEEIAFRVRGLAELLRAELGAVPGVEVQDRGVDRCGIVTFTVEGGGPWQIKHSLAKRGVNVKVIEPDTARLDLEARGLTALIRASVHYYNSEVEVDRFCAALASVVPKLVSRVP